MHETKDRVRPADFNAYSNTHHFRAPCCLCAVHEVDSTAYTEAAIFIANDGEDIGKYMTGCAQNKCGYLGKISISVSFIGPCSHFCNDLVCIERMYAVSGLPSKIYPRRG